jgi:hypothetical protein
VPRVKAFLKYTFVILFINSSYSNKKLDSMSLESSTAQSLG